MRQHVNLPNPFYSRRSTRLPGYDYRQMGIYFVTLCAFRKAKLFGDVSMGIMRHSALGEIAELEWQRIAEVRHNVGLDQFVVMPNHLHSLVMIDRSEGGYSGKRSSVSTGKAVPRLQAGSLGAVIGQYKLAVLRRAKSWPSPARGKIIIWQRGYYDHIVRDERSLNEIRQYILENPAKWTDDSLYWE